MLGQLSNWLRPLLYCEPSAILFRFVSKETLLLMINILLRVPSLFLMEVWMRSDSKDITVSWLLSKSGDNASHNSALEMDGTYNMAVKFTYYSVVAFALALAFLPLKKLITLYLHLTSAALILAANYCSNLYVEEEKSSGNDDVSILEQKDSVQRAMCHVVGQVLCTATISYLLSVNRWIMFMLSGYLFPIIARGCRYPARDLHKVHNFSTLLVMSVVFYFLFQIVPKVLDAVNNYLKQLWDGIQVFGYLPFAFAVWKQMNMGLQFLIFWIVLISIQLYHHVMTHDRVDSLEGCFIVIITSMAKCCVTPVSLFGLCVAISYVSNVILTATRFYLQGREALLETVNMTQQGYTEGFTMLLLALQTDLLDLKPTQRALFMCIVLFIVVSALIQSMADITEPILITLGAAQNKSTFKHVRTIVLSTALWMFPLYMVYVINQFFDMDFWLMVVISSCVLTSVQVIGSLVTYLLFVVDAFGPCSIDNLDDYVYYAKATTRFLEFIVAVLVVGFGVRSSFYGDWSWLNAVILLVHCYFNVWQRLTSGWSTYLLRREASKKVGALRDATRDELTTLNDICSICYQPMNAAKVTHCQHYFHELCLRKWLYVQETCPMCHHEIKCEKQSAASVAAAGHVAATGAAAGHVAAGMATNTHVSTQTDTAHKDDSASSMENIRDDEDEQSNHNAPVNNTDSDSSDGIND